MTSGDTDAEGTTKHMRMLLMKLDIFKGAMASI